METTWKSHTAKSFPRRLSVLLDNESIGAVRHCGLANNEIAVSSYYRKLSHGEDEMYDGVCFVDSPAQKRNGASIFINASPSLTYASYPWRSYEHPDVVPILTSPRSVTCSCSACDPAEMLDPWL